MCKKQFLSPHFLLKEFTESATARKHGIVNVPPPTAVENLRALCIHTLEPLREALGLPIIITSGFRTMALNNLLAHASSTSQHMQGRAADFYVARGPVQGSKFKVQGGEAPTRRELLIKAFREILLNPKIDFDQLILYPSFIHVSYVSRERNRRKITTANGQGTYCAVSRVQALALA